MPVMSETSRSAQAALADLRTTVKWLVAGSGAVAASLVAGLQLSRLSGLSPVRAIVAGVAAAVAIGLALALITMAVRVLATPRCTSTELSNLELADESVTAQMPRGPTSAPNPLEASNNALLRWIGANRSRLLGEDDFVTQVVRRELNAHKALRSLRAGEAATWEGRNVEPTDAAALATIEQVRDEAGLRLSAVEDALLLHQSQENFAKLLRRFPWGAAVFTVAVIVFALASA